MAIGCGSPCVCVGGPPANFCNDAGYSCGPYRVKDNCGRDQEFNCGGCDTDAGKVCSRNDWGGVCGPCSSEDDLTFCDRAGANCGPRTAPDNCGVTRTVDCCACADGGACGSSGQANQCALQPNLSGCVTSAQCQSGTCGGGGLCCAAPLHACLDDSDCCRGSCAQNFCEPNPQ